ncbi:hypothetical protein [Botryobacter ruber]|uniref:hypothetical protein n=1 Tax=Botryobacter ruber TaxID=2171629 RepID=UPI000E0A7C78|nr:hypothetical protein [Botryobacter ruber]
MIQPAVHTFHIPVMGLGFSIDSPLKVAQFGISSVISLGDDTLIEQMRAHYCQLYQKPYEAITSEQEDYRARRITAYLDLVDELVKQQIEEVRQEEFVPGTRLTKYFELLPESSLLKQDYLFMLQETDMVQQYLLQQELKHAIVPGNIDVNIMTKLDKANFGPTGEMLPQEYSDALAALRGFANSKVHSSVVLSAGMNMRLFSYMENFPCFYPDAAGRFQKRIIVKVSDYRSAIVQGKMLAKRGLFVSEFRIESGLNCGGHAFATDGYLLGPIMEEFRQHQNALRQELYSLFCSSLASRGLHVPYHLPELRLTVQGGIGTAEEHEFLLQHYGMDSTGWGTPFLLVPEATTVDEETLQRLTSAGKEDLYLSPVSPLGIPFNTLRGSTGEENKYDRVERGVPGSPCVKKHLVSNTEFTDEPICTASRQYQHLKLQQLRALNLSPEAYREAEAAVLAKECLCEGLANTAVFCNNIQRRVATKGVSICPGPNLAYFSQTFTLQQMVDHIYGRFNALNNSYRPHMFINELHMYIDYWKNKKHEHLNTLSEKQLKYLQAFWQNLQEGIGYYKQLLPSLFPNHPERQVHMLDELQAAQDELFAEALEVVTL